jgi:hypothetical protein
MASITSGEMADCDWLRSTFSGPLLWIGGPLRKNKRMHFKTKQQNKLKI